MKRTRSLPSIESRARANPVECCVCFGLQPDFTPCGHPLCHSCLQRMSLRWTTTSAAQLACPMCRSPLDVPGTEAHIQRRNGGGLRGIPESRIREHSTSWSRGVVSATEPHVQRRGSEEVLNEFNLEHQFRRELGAAIRRFAGIGSIPDRPALGAWAP